MTETPSSSSLSEQELEEVRRAIMRWGEDNYREYPWRSPDENWHGLAAEILLQRTRAQNVVPVYREFVDRFPEPIDLAEASEDEILDIIGCLGLHWRASVLKQLGVELSERETIPRSHDGLRELTGVGEYVASAWLSFHGGQRGVLVDANVVRWICRMVGREYDGETRRDPWVRDLLDRITPEDRHRHFNFALLDFTMTVCRSSSPACAECPIGPKVCQYGEQKLIGHASSE